MNQSCHTVQKVLCSTSRNARGHQQLNPSVFPGKSCRKSSRRWRHCSGDTGSKGQTKKADNFVFVLSAHRTRVCLSLLRECSSENCSRRGDRGAAHPAVFSTHVHASQLPDHEPRSQPGDCAYSSTLPPPPPSFIIHADVLLRAATLTPAWFSSMLLLLLIRKRPTTGWQT